MIVGAIKILAAVAKRDDDDDLEGVELDAGGVPVAFRVWRAGENMTDHGRTVFSERSAVALMAQQAARGNLFSVDVDHLSLSDAAPPESRKAVGWHRLEVRRDKNGAPELWAVGAEWVDFVRAGLAKDPPEWRYFSPAYDVDPKTREVVRYLNTAITNNPATWSVTTLASATSATEPRKETTMKWEDILAALRAAATAEGDSDEKKQAAQMLAALEGGEEKPKDDEPKKDASDAPDHGEPDGDEPKKDSTATSTITELASVVQSLVSRISKIEVEGETAERARLLASRSDLAPELVSILAKAPIGIVRETVAKLPRQGAERAADTSAKPTVAAGAPTASRLPPKEKEELDARMGLLPMRATTKREGNTLILGAMTPATNAAKEG